MTNHDPPHVTTIEEEPLVSATTVSTQQQTIDRLRDLYKYLRVTDVCDAMDGIGYFNIGLMDPKVRPLWPGIRFWGVALTIRCVPADQPMWKLNTTQEIIDQHPAWWDHIGRNDEPNAAIGERLMPGHVVVADSGGVPEVGYFGSANTLRAHVNGAVGLVTDGACRDTAEVVAQRTPVFAGSRGRTIIPGRIEVAEVNARIACGGVSVSPGDVVGGDDDGIVVVPQRVAEEVAVHARGILLHDINTRKGLYDKGGIAPDETVDAERIRAHYAALDSH